MDDHRPDLRRVIICCKFEAETLVEGQRGGFRGSVFGHLRGGDPRGGGGDRDDHPVVRAHHFWDELAYEAVVCERIDVECEFYVFLRGLQEVLPAADGGVIDEHCGRANGVANLLCDIPHGRRVRDVTSVVEHVWRALVRQGLHIEDNRLYAARSEALNNARADAIGSASDDNDLARPVILVGSSVIEDATLEVVIYNAEPGQDGEDAGVFENGGVLTRDLIASRHAGEVQEEGKGEEGIEGCAADDATEGVGVEAFAREPSFAVERTAHVCEGLGTRKDGCGRR